MDAFFRGREKRAGEGVGFSRDEDGEHSLIVAQQKKKGTAGQVFMSSCSNPR